jgi:hypothetical protein
MPTRNERLVAAWDIDFGDGCEPSPEDIIDQWAGIAADYPGGWAQLAIDLFNGLPDESPPEPDIVTMPWGEVDLAPATRRTVLARLIGGMRSIAISMEDYPPELGAGDHLPDPKPPWAG